MSFPTESDITAERASKHYSSKNAQNLYDIIIGSETLNLGLYDDPPTRTISQAMKETTKWMAENVVGLDNNFCVLDIGSGYGYSARYLAQKYECHVTCLNISSEQNIKNEKLNKKQSLSHKIDIILGNFKEMPLKNMMFDLVWTQDALFHSDNLDQVLSEAYRVLKPGGQFLLMDILQSDDCKVGALKEALSRVNIHHESIGSFK